MEEAVLSILDRTLFFVNFGQPDRNPWVAKMPSEPRSVEQFFDKLQKLMPREYRREGRQIKGVNIDPKRSTEDLAKLPCYLERGSGQKAWETVCDALIDLGKRDTAVKPRLGVTVLWSQDI